MTAFYGARDTDLAERPTRARIVWLRLAELLALVAGIAGITLAIVAVWLMVTP